MTTEWQSLISTLATRKSYGCMLNKNLCEQRARQARRQSRRHVVLARAGRLVLTDDAIVRLPD